MEKHALLANVEVGAVDDEGIARSRRVKRCVVDRDPRERHLRQALNLGHTFAHAFEARFGLSHGDAVLHGLEQALRLSVDVAGLDAAVAKERCARLRALGAPALPRLDDDAADAVLDAMARDKKGAKKLVLLRAPGRPVLCEVERSVVRRQLVRG
jgi:3-dehydroquinate synthetase